MSEYRRKIGRIVSGHILTHLVYWILRMLRATIRIRFEGAEHIAEQVARGEGFIGMFWHCRLLMIPFLYPGRKMHVLISTHRDGEIIAKIMKCFGFDVVRGSSSKGGRKALMEMARLLRDGNDLAITPDGPRGPAEVLKPGIAHVARLSGKKVLPVAYAASRCFRLTSWDRLIIPAPFSRGLFVVGAPVAYEEGEDMEAFRLRLEQALRDTTARADAMVR
jgi:lysophospholipid acyltransferase (LPLAT)-like uncharacterized protein